MPFHNKEKKRNKYSHVVDKNSSFRMVESYNSLRANLLFAISTSEKRSVIFTSSEPGAGKSTTCSNLAISMAQTGARVVLIDADMRKPVQHKIFKLVNNKGLSEILSGLTELEEGLQDTRFSGVDLITSGPIPPNPSELLGSQRMVDLMNLLSLSYDYIFIDTPPINVVADATMFLEMVGGVLLVARQKQTHYEELQRASDRIKSLQGNILGVVLTGVRDNNKPYKSYNDYTYL